MNFISELFLLFLLVSLVGFYSLPSKFRVIWLLAASYIFYASWSVAFLSIILITTTIDYILSQIIERNRASQSIQKTCLVIGLLSNLAVLFSFKYANFSLGALSYFVDLMHWKVLWPRHLDVILPLGISFYTFEAVSYLVDVYRGNKPAKNFLTYNFYIMYFPHLISGPIVRFNELMHQYQNGIGLPSKSTILRGAELVILGFAFKVLIANQVAPLVDSFYQNSQQIDPLRSWVAILAFSCQVYFDFMGYTHIARGVSLFFNLELPLNFDHPYNAPSITQFWQRWHISLGRWIRDYLYSPLRRPEPGRSSHYRNVLLVMLIVGAWHGAGWTFIVWGLFQGIWMSLEYAWVKFLHRSVNFKPTDSVLYASIAAPFTFIIFSVSLVIFRSQSLAQAQIVLNSLVHVDTAARLLMEELGVNNLTSVLTIIFLLMACLSGPVVVRLFERMFSPTPFLVRLSAAWILIAAIWIGSANEYKPFFYFQF